jgi:hypothetical protein
VRLKAFCPGDSKCRCRVQAAAEQNHSSPSLLHGFPQYRGAAS